MQSHPPLRPRWAMLFFCLLMLLPALSLKAWAQAGAQSPRFVKPVPPPTQVGELLRTQAVQTGSLIRVEEARRVYGVNGDGLTAAVLDTGIRATHQDFAGKVVAQVNYTSNNGGDTTNAADGDGHGTHVSGIIAANAVHTGMAPGARIAALKVLDNNGSGTFQVISNALAWVVANHQTYNITVVNMSLGDGGNYRSMASDTLQLHLRTLRTAGVAVCVAAGNDFYRHGSVQGMSYPAVFPETVSVGAVYDGNIGGVSYGDGARANTTGPDRICPFSQRLHESVAAAPRTDLLAPGAAITSTGISTDSSSATSHGTSQATPVVAGVILLMQQYYRQQMGSLPTVDQLERWLRAGSVANVDGDNEDDNVTNTGLTFPRIDAVAAMQALEQDLNTGYSVSGTVTLSGAGLSGVTVSGGGKTATTGSDGRYTLTGFTSGAVTVTPARSGYTFTPTSRTVTLGPSASGVDFTATQTAFTLSGTVTVDGAGLSGVTVAAGNRTTLTNAAGQYAFTDLGSGTYTVSASRSGYSFSPASRTVTLGPDGRDINFTGTRTTYAVTGGVTLGGSGLGGVTVTGGGQTTLTASNGAYSLEGLTPGTYSVSATRAGYRFSPANHTVTVGPNATRVDFAATRVGYTLQGTVREGGAGLAGVTVSAAGRSATTDAQGRYTLTEIPEGNQTIVPARSGYAFSPASTTLSITQDWSGIDFTATAVTYQVSGRVTQGGQGLQGVNVAAGAFTTSTDPTGNYTLAGLSGGTYTVTASADGYALSPAGQTVTVGPSRTGVNFTAEVLLSIRGTVRADGAGLSGVTVTGGGKTATTDTGGTYALTDLAPGSYTVKAEREGYELTPASRTVTLSAADQTGIDFAAGAVPSLLSLTPRSPSVSAGKRTVVTVEFSGKVSRPTTVFLSSSSSAVLIPRQVRVRKNRNRVNFKVRTRRLDSAERVTLTATSGGITRQATITIQPKLR